MITFYTCRSIRSRTFGSRHRRTHHRCMCGLAISYRERQRERELEYKVNYRQAQAHIVCESCYIYTLYRDARVCVYIRCKREQILRYATRQPVTHVYITLGRINNTIATCTHTFTYTYIYHANYVYLIKHRGSLVTSSLQSHKTRSTNYHYISSEKDA